MMATNKNAQKNTVFNIILIVLISIFIISFALTFVDAMIQREGGKPIISDPIRKLILWIIPISLLAGATTSLIKWLKNIKSARFKLNTFFSEPFRYLTPGFLFGLFLIIIFLYFIIPLLIVKQ